jgi:methylmalonyl-CoA mutase
MSISSLADGFERATYDAWRERVSNALKDAEFASLIDRTPDGIVIEPLYQPAAATPIASRPAGAAWDIVTVADHTDVGTSNRQVLDDLEGGASGISIAFALAANAGGFGLPPSGDTLRGLLQDVYLDLVHLRIEPHPRSRRSAHWMAGLFEQRGIEPVRATVSFGLDPIGNFARRGALPADGETVAGRLAGTVDLLRGKGFAGRFVEADGRPYHAAGANDAQELGAVLATEVHYLRVLTETGGLGIDEAFAAIGVSLAADQHQLTSAAKMRAARLLWRRLQDLCGAEPSDLRLHAETARRMMMADDPHTNLLRTTLAAFAAGTGGADSIAILPYSCPLGLADAQARRTARNLHHLLLEESNLHRVADPTAGSGAIEALTDGLCAAAWAEFQAIEAEGGILESLQSGALQIRIGAAREALRKAVADGEKPFVGATIYPNATQAKVALLEAESWPDPVLGDAVLECAPLLPTKLVKG